MQTRIQGTVMPVLEVQLDPNDSVFAESGELSWMTASIQMTTHTQMGGGGGLLGMFKRAVGGGSFFMTEYRAVQMPGEVAFATKVPGHIVPVPVSPSAANTLCIATAFSAPRRRSRLVWAFSNRWAPAFSAATGFCCRRSAAAARRGWSFPAN